MEKIINENANSILEAINTAYHKLPIEKTDKKTNNFYEAVKFLCFNYNFYRNVITGNIEYKNKKDMKLKVLDDIQFDNLLSKLYFKGIRIQDKDLRTILANEKIVENIQPFLRYFDSLQRYEGKCEYYENGEFKSTSGRDYIKEFTDQIKLKNEALRNYLVETFRKWFVGMVVSLYDDEISMYKINQICFILVGKQGKFKTTFFRKLIPKSLGYEYFYSGSLNFNDKDIERKMATKMIICMDELASFKRSDNEIVKAKITQEYIEVRPAYYKTNIKQKRRASFCGTINQKEILKDDTGSRRFVVHEIENIEIDESFPIDKMYAQGLQHYRDGFKYWLDENNIVEVESQNEEFESKSVEYEFLSKKFKVPDESTKKEDLVSLTATDIAKEINEELGIPINSNLTLNIGKELSKLGFHSKRIKKNGQSIKVWILARALANNTDEFDS